MENSTSKMYQLSIMDSALSLLNNDLIKWASPGTIIRGENYDIAIIIKNKGPDTFPGGSIVRYQYDFYGNSFSTVSISLSKIKDSGLDYSFENIPSISPGSSHIIKDKVTFNLEGICYFSIGITSIDGIPVKIDKTLHQSGIPLQIINRETVLILDKLDKLLSR